MNTMMKKMGLLGLLAAGAMVSGGACAHADAAHVTAEDAWARMSVAGQQASGAFVRLTAQEPLRLVGVESPVAEVGEIHEMAMDGDVMRMRAIDGLDLPQGKTVELKPGGYHLMLQQLKTPLAQGTEVPMTLVFQDAQGQTSRLHLQVPVRRMAAGAHHGHGSPQAAGAMTHHGKSH